MDDNKWPGNGWTTYQKLVLSKLEDHQEELKAINKKLSDLKSETTTEYGVADLGFIKSGLYETIFQYSPTTPLGNSFDFLSAINPPIF